MKKSREPPGRFTSPDPSSASAINADAQTFNRYAYCRNNPVNSTDPTGMNDHSAAAAASERQGIINGLRESGLGVLAEEESRYEDYMAAAQAGLLQNTSVDEWDGLRRFPKSAREPEHYFEG
jgi:hypothetical protein